MADWIIEPFGSHHDRTAFSCGRPSLDDFLRAYASQYEKRRLGKIFVAVPALKTEEEHGRVIGYYTLAAGAVAFERLPAQANRKLPKPPVPVVLLARLAVDSKAQGKGLGERLLLGALQRSLDLSNGLGVYAVEVVALDEVAAAFYRKYGFASLLDNPLHLYLPITTIKILLD